MGYSRVKEAIIRIEYPDQRCEHRSYVSWENAKKAKVRIMEKFPNCRCYIYRIADASYFLSLFEKKEEELPW